MPEECHGHSRDLKRWNQGRTDTKEIQHDIKIFFFYEIIPLFQNVLLVNISCTHSKIRFFLLLVFLIFLFKEPFLWQSRQKCHGAA